MYAHEMIPDTSGSYEIQDSKGNVIYVGSTGNLYQRFKSHRSELIANKHYNKNLQNFYNNVDKNLQFRFVTCVDRDEAYNLEQIKLDTLSTTGTLANIRKDARCCHLTPEQLRNSEETKLKKSLSHIGKKHSEETKAKIGLAHKGLSKPKPEGYVMSEETKAKISSAHKGISKSEEHKAKLSKSRLEKIASGEITSHNLGKHLSEETKAKISSAHKGKVITEQHRKAISDGSSQVKPVTIDGITYRSQTDAANTLNISITCLKYRCESKNFPTWNK